MHLLQYVLGVFTMLAAAGAHAQGPRTATLQDLAELSIEQLANLQVTSVSGRAQNLRGAASSIYVITSEEIRRSAAHNLPEALRLAPNLQVARLNSGQYAISARGFNNAIGNKLLVLIDGRTVYSSLFSGVFWDHQDVMLEDIDRIEVISGPGATIWGANAVNGVINVVSRHAAESAGLLAATGRSRSGGESAVRWGDRMAGGHLRFYGLAIDRDNTSLASGLQRADASSKRQAGFRGDWRVAGSTLTVQGDAFESGKRPASNLAPFASGANLLARWDSHFADGTPYRLQAYTDYVKRDETVAFRNEALTADVQFTHEPRGPQGHKILWGGGVRWTRDRNDASPLALFVPLERDLKWWNVFAQDQVELSGGVSLTAGLKAEHNSFTGLELLPSLRASWLHAGGDTTWAALSRSVRAPARLDRDFHVPGGPPFLIAGGPDFRSEVARVLEVGHRGQLGTRLQYDVALFRQQYTGLRGGVGVAPAVITNRIEGSVSGVEAWATWQAMPSWRLSAGGTALRKRLAYTANAPPDAATGIANLGNDPRAQWKFRSQWDIGPRWDLDVVVRRVGALPLPAVPAYTAVDARLAWLVRDGLEIALAGQNLLDERHTEFNAPASASEHRRRLFLRLTWQP